MTAIGTLVSKQAFDGNVPVEGLIAYHRHPPNAGKVFRSLSDPTTEKVVMQTGWGLFKRRKTIWDESGTLWDEPGRPWDEPDEIGDEWARR